MYSLELLESFYVKIQKNKIAIYIHIFIFEHFFLHIYLVNCALVYLRLRLLKRLIKGFLFRIWDKTMSRDETLTHTADRFPSSREFANRVRGVNARPKVKSAYMLFLVHNIFVVIPIDLDQIRIRSAAFDPRIGDKIVNMNFPTWRQKKQHSLR